MTLIFIAYMAAMHRLHGWGGFKYCRAVSQFGSALAFGCMVYLETGSDYKAALATLVTYFTYSLGHGDGFRGVERKNTIVSPIAKRLAGVFGFDRSSKDYDRLFFFIKGFIIGLVPAVLFPFGFAMALFPAAIGLSWALAYEAGYKLFPNRYSTLAAEYISGALTALSIIAAV